MFCATLVCINGTSAHMQPGNIDKACKFDRTASGEVCSIKLCLNIVRLENGLVELMMCVSLQTDIINSNPITQSQSTVY